MWDEGGSGSVPHYSYTACFCYLMLIVVPAGLLVVPMVSTTGTGPAKVGLAGKDGTMASISMTPETYPAADPAYTMVAGALSIIRETAACGVWTNRPPATTPSCP